MSEGEGCWKHNATAYLEGREEQCRFPMTNISFAFQEVFPWEKTKWLPDTSSWTMAVGSDAFTLRHSSQGVPVVPAPTVWLAMGKPWSSGQQGTFPDLSGSGHAFQITMLVWVLGCSLPNSSQGRYIAMFRRELGIPRALVLRHSDQHF